MHLGWVDFSKTDRNKMLAVLDMLSEKPAVDELGIGAIRDSFADIFFPGSSTIQTRAKYFLIIPRIFRDLEKADETNVDRVLASLYGREKNCCEVLVKKNPDITGIIGKRGLGSDKWIKRTPSDIYWAGLRRYGIFTGGDISISEYVRAMCAQKSDKISLKKMGNHNDNNDSDTDDADAENGIIRQYWHIPTYQKNWVKELDIHLTKAEGKYLKEQIVMTCDEDTCILSYILKNDRRDIVANANSFQELKPYIKCFPEAAQTRYILAYDFSHFIYALRVLYNVIASDEKNADALIRLSEITPNLKNIAKNVQINELIKQFPNIVNGYGLIKFIEECKTLMEESDIKRLKQRIINRECDIKGERRAKTRHPGEYDENAWLGGYELDYRYSNSRIIMNDIFESEGI
ncbi:hypothetical protein SAMN02910370_02190 [Lachnospiraceae bacterium XPB1003]|nr:hypothetical protein SAMN02910370_02190 [Lachnospiraceae bacterium XPB1003]